MSGSVGLCVFGESVGAQMSALEQWKNAARASLQACHGCTVFPRPGVSASYSVEGKV